MKVYVRLGIVAALVAGFAVGAVAQGPPAQPAPQGPPAGRLARGRFQNPDRAAMIRAQIEERWGQRIQERLGLNDQQMDRLRTVTRASQDRQRDLDQRESDLMRAVMEQLRPGVAANQDSLGRALDALALLRVQRAQSEQQEMRELGQFLNPVQRAQLLVMRRQLLNRIEQIRRGMGPGQGGLRPGLMGPPAPPDSQPEGGTE